MKLNIYSWNVLNPNVNISVMTWKRLCDKQTSRKISQIDFSRFCAFRKQAIINVLISWLQCDKIIICLQEVCKDLLNDIKKIPNIKVGNTELLKDNCQVTIVKGLKPIFSEYELNIANKDKRMLKTTFNNIEINNVHLHWTWTAKHLSIIGRLIDSSIESKYYVICGDMNKTFTTLQPLMNEFDCLELQSGLKGYTGVNTVTNKLDIIDHIFLSTNIESHSDIKILNKVNDYHIFYNFKKIISYFKNDFTTSNWLKKRHNKDLSDHKPITISINM